MALRLACMLAVAVFTVLKGHNCASWLSPLTDSQVKYACAGETLTLPWQLNVTNGQTISDVQWYFHGQSEEIVAIFSHGQFVSLPAFAERVSQVGNAGIALSHVNPGDTGDYSVEVSVEETSGSLIRVRQTVDVHVADGLMTTDGSLHASLLSQPVLDNSTQQFALVLACGNFTYAGHPPFDVQWTDPKGNTLLSSNYAYAGGFFQLLLSTPVTGGTYSCQVPPSAATAACLPGATDVTVNVDETAARLSLLEASQSRERALFTQQILDLEEKQAAMNQHIHDLEISQTAMEEVSTQQQALLTQQSHQIHDLEANLTTLNQTLHDLEANQTALKEVNIQQRDLLTQRNQRIQDLEEVQVPSLNNQVNNLTQQLHDVTSGQVSFLARLSRDVHPSYGATIVFNNVVNNVANAYSSTSGAFTAPIAGSYYFAVAIVCSGNELYMFGDKSIKSDNGDVCHIGSCHSAQHGSCQGLKHLSEGQRVWVTTYGVHVEYRHDDTIFAGFLVSVDP